MCCTTKIYCFPKPGQTMSYLLLLVMMIWRYKPWQPSKTQLFAYLKIATHSAKQKPLGNLISTKKYDTTEAENCIKSVIN